MDDGTAQSSTPAISSVDRCNGQTGTFEAVANSSNHHRRRLSMKEGHAGTESSGDLLATHNYIDDEFVFVEHDSSGTGPPSVLSDWSIEGLENGLDTCDDEVLAPVSNITDYSLYNERDATLDTDVC